MRRRDRVSSRRITHVPIPHPDMIHVRNMAYEVGLIHSNGMGPCEVSHQEIAAWRDVTGVELKPWQAILIKRLSREFVSAVHEFADPNARQPYSGNPPMREPEHRSLGAAITEAQKMMTKK